LNAKGKLLGPNTTTAPPSGPYFERMLTVVSMVARHHERSLAAAAPWRSWLTVLGSSA
jgi:hypothetical protein